MVYGPDGRRRGKSPPTAEVAQRMGLCEADQIARDNSPTQSGTMMCICEICTCGRCRCPVHGQKMKKNVRQRVNLPFEGNTTVQDDYRGYSMDEMRETRSSSFKPQYTPATREGDIGYSEYHDMYKKKEMERGRKEGNSMPKQARQRVNLPFEGSSIYHDDFVEHPHEKVQQSRMKDEWVKPTGGMSGETTSRADYVRHELEKRKGLEKKMAKQRVNLPFEGTSNYAADFTTHDISSTTQKFKMKDEWAHDFDLPLESQTTNRADYVSHQLEKRASLGKMKAKQRVNLPFEGVSEQHERFREYDPQEWRDALGNRTGKPPMEYQPPTESYEMHTTYRGDFTEKDIQRGQMIEKQKANARARVNLPFEGESTNRLDFQGQQGEADDGARYRQLQKIRNAKTQPWENADSYFGTTNRNDYTHTPCPVTVLKQKADISGLPPPGREHIYYDDGSEKWY